jgi:hypothetical protein
VSSSTGITSSLADVSGESLFDNIHAMLPFDTMSVISKAPPEKARGSAQTGLPFYSRSCPVRTDTMLTIAVASNHSLGRKWSLICMACCIETLASQEQAPSGS